LLKARCIGPNNIFPETLFDKSETIFFNIFVNTYHYSVSDQNFSRRIMAERMNEKKKKKVKNVRLNSALKTKKSLLKRLATNQKRSHRVAKSTQNKEEKRATSMEFLQHIGEVNHYAKEDITVKHIQKVLGNFACDEAGMKVDAVKDVFKRGEKGRSPNAEMLKCMQTACTNWPENKPFFYINRHSTDISHKQPQDELLTALDGKSTRQTVLTNLVKKPLLQRLSHAAVCHLAAECCKRYNLEEKTPEECREYVEMIVNSEIPALFENNMVKKLMHINISLKEVDYDQVMKDVLRVLEMYGLDQTQDK
jgi:hypothetical protein